MSRITSGMNVFMKFSNFEIICFPYLSFLWNEKCKPFQLIWANKRPFNRRWHISTIPFKTKKGHCSNWYSSLISSPWDASWRKIKIKLEKHKFSLLLKLEVCGLKTQLSIIPQVKFLLFRHKATKGNHITCSISLNSVRLFLVLWGVATFC